MANLIIINPKESIFINVSTSNVSSATSSAVMTVTDSSDTKIFDAVSVSKDAGLTQYQVRITYSDTSSWSEGIYDLVIYESDSTTGYGSYVYEAKIKVEDNDYL